MWIEPFAGLPRTQFARLVALVRRRGGDVQRDRPWGLPLGDRVLLVVTYWRTNLTLRQVAPLFGVSKSAAGRILDHLAPLLAISPARRSREGAVYIVDGTWCRPVIAAWRRPARTSGTRPTCRSLSTQTVAWSWRSDSRCPAAEMTAGRSQSLASTELATESRPSPTAATKAPDSSFHTAEAEARVTSARNRRRRTPSTAVHEHAWNTPCHDSRTGRSCETADSRATEFTRPCSASPACTTWPSPDDSNSIGVASSRAMRRAQGSGGFDEQVDGRVEGVRAVPDISSSPSSAPTPLASSEPSTS